MKLPTTDTDPQSPSPTPLKPQQFPLHAQSDPTTGRDSIRQVSHVPAPRQSERPAERSSKARKAGK